MLPNLSTETTREKSMLKSTRDSFCTPHRIWHVCNSLAHSKMGEANFSDLWGLNKSSHFPAFEACELLKMQGLD